MVEKITYRNWTECYKISNNVAELIVVAESGGRVLSYKFNGEEIIYENPELNGKKLADYRETGFDPDGGRFDYGPEKLTQKVHDKTWIGCWNAEINSDYSVKLSSVADTGLQVQTIREFILDTDTSHLIVRQTMTNISNSATDLWFWFRTLVRFGGKLFMPINPKSTVTNGWAKYWDSKTNVSIKDNLLIYDPKAEGKIGTDSKEGWLAYAYENLLFVASVEYFPNEAYGEENGFTSIFYSKGESFSEVEPVSPKIHLKPNESYTFVEHWNLYDYQQAGGNVLAAAEFIRTVK